MNGTETSFNFEHLAPKDFKSSSITTLNNQISIEIAVQDKPKTPRKRYRKSRRNEYSANSEEIIIQNVAFNGNHLETAYLLAVRITNKLIKDGLYSYFGPICFIDISKKAKAENQICTACLGLWNINLHNEFIVTLNAKLRFYGKTVFMKLGRNRPRSTFTWVSQGPHKPSKSVNFAIPLQSSIIILEPKQNEINNLKEPNESLCCNCCCNCCKLSCDCCKLFVLLLRITRDFYKAFKNSISENIQPVEMPPKSILSVKQNNSN